MIITVDDRISNPDQYKADRKALFFSRVQKCGDSLEIFYR